MNITRDLKVVVTVVVRAPILKYSRRCRLRQISSKKVADIISSFSLICNLLISVHRAVSTRHAARSIMQPSGAKMGVIQGVASKKHVEALMQFCMHAATIAPLFDARLTSTVHGCTPTTTQSSKLGVSRLVQDPLFQLTPQGSTIIGLNTGPGAVRLPMK